ncbi:MAG: biopolymer transporter ExbD [Verrucomicrobiales bacterium]|nr:biopolymer transporter ExbD [Verrucomicrobiales bacterium]
MAKRRRTAQAEDEPQMDMSSMIDVSFLLLIYFLVTSTLDPKEADLGFTLPTSQSNSAVEVELDQNIIEVNDEGHIVMNEETLDTDTDSRKLPMLEAKLREIVSAANTVGQDPLVIISANDTAKGQRFVDVLNTLALKGIEITNVTLTGFTDDE